jgi:thiol-disulfide isomerase/thioredoxin
MSSFQNAAPGAKSLKFVNSLDPFAGFLGREQDDSAVEEPSVTEQMDSRLRLNERPAMQIPSMAHEQQQSRSMQQQQQTIHPSNAASEATNTTQDKKNSSKDEDNDDDDNDSDFGSDYEDDNAALEAFRQKRLAELKRDHQQTAEHKAKGHGQVRIISQDEFLPECTSSKFVVVHFFHKEFARCQIMSHHLKRIAPGHLQCKFVEIDAERAPFFVVKLKVQTLPTLIVFKDGQAIDRLVGFEELSSDAKNPDEFPTSRLGYWLEKMGAIEYEGPDSDEEQEGSGNKTLAGIGRSKIGSSNQYAVYDEDI